MPSFPVDWVDAFADRPFAGNGCAVVHGGAALDDETAMRFVRETSLVECTFTGPSEVADLRVRYFLASREIPFAGHPTIATAAALALRGQAETGALTFETGAGIVPVRFTAEGVQMRQAKPSFGDCPPVDLVAAACGLEVSDIIHAPQIVSTGLPFCITVVKDKQTLRRARLDVDALAAFCAASGYAGTDMMEPFLVTLDGATEQGDTFARLLLAPPSPPEDPFTGSATGAMAAYLWHTGLMQKPRFVAEQGHDIGRPGRAVVERVGSAYEPDGVLVTGAAYRVMSGELHL